MEGAPIPRGHDADFLALPGAGKAEHVAHAGNLADIVQLGFGHILGPERIAGHEHEGGDFSLFRLVMRGSGGKMLQLSFFL
jgi:hypothetical protein